MRKGKAGFGFIEILLVMAIIAFIAYKVFNVYFKKSFLDKETQKFISEQGIDTTSYKSTIDSTRDKLKDIQSNRTAQ
jgi:prepilin-type N-terminal cleavage/methylation domain-containing protein